MNNLTLQSSSVVRPLLISGVLLQHMMSPYVWHNVFEQGTSGGALALSALSGAFLIDLVRCSFLVQLKETWTTVPRRMR